MINHRPDALINSRSSVRAGWRLILLGLFIGLASPAQADPPRVLHTSFDEYARQQQQHDQQLAQQGSASRKTATSASAETHATAAKNPAASKTASMGKTAATVKTATTAKKSASQKSAAPVNINTADEASLSNSLIGVGPAKARAIVEYRQQNGQFKQPEDLLAVKGIGPATLEKNRSRIRVN